MDPTSTLDGFMLGGSPFFTSVPSGRVGFGPESVFRSNDEFKQEVEDLVALEEKLSRALSKQERSRIGVSNLRLFLEELLLKRYMDSVPSTVTLLEKDYWRSTRKLNELDQQLSSLNEAKLKEKGRTLHDLFLTKLSLLLKGTIISPPDRFGETLQDERVNGGAFIGSVGLQFPHILIPLGCRLLHILKRLLPVAVIFFRERRGLLEQPRCISEASSRCRQQFCRIH